MTSVPAATQVLAILRLLSRRAEPQSAAGIARALDLPRSTTYHLLAVLAADGFVVRLPEERRWGLGLAAYELGSGYLRQAPLERLARAPLAHLVDGLGHSAHLAVLHGTEVVYVIEERARRRASLVSDVGVRLPAHLTATGRAMLAALPAPQVRALYPHRSAFVTRTGEGPGSLSALRSVLGRVRRDGVAREDGEVTPGVASLGCAVLDRSGHPVAAVAVTWAAADLAADEEDRVEAAVRRTSADLSRRLGGTSGGSSADRAAAGPAGPRS